MQLHELKKIPGAKAARRVGRGGKRGTTSGRGQKGQRSRSGRRIRPAMRDLVLRIPKRRGFGNKPKSGKPLVISLRDVARRAKPPASGGAVEVTRDTLVQLSLVPKGCRGEVKILGSCAVPVPLVVRGIQASASARKAIEAAGGEMV